MPKSNCCYAVDRIGQALMELARRFECGSWQDAARDIDEIINPTNRPHDCTHPVATPNGMQRELDTNCPHPLNP